MTAYNTAKRTLEIHIADEPGIHVTTGRNEIFSFLDGEPAPRMTGLAAAVLVTRLRWWADHIEATATEADS